MLQVFGLPSAKSLNVCKNNDKSIFYKILPISCASSLLCSGVNKAMHCRLRVPSHTPL